MLINREQGFEIAPVLESYTSRNLADKLPSRPVDGARPLKVIYIGAGISGIVAAIHFKRLVPSLELVIYEKNADIGGTWYENRYPGCACDVPSHAYQLSFESWPEWSQFYSGREEIWQYWDKVAEKYGVRSLVRFKHKCLEASWDEKRSKWRVKLERSDLEKPTAVEDEADVFITGTGILNEWKWPDINGLQSFQGRLLHTAAWDETFDSEGKDVAVIGAGSSGIQVVPAIVSKVKRMDHYVRSKTWISDQFDAKHLRARTEDLTSDNFTYDAGEKEMWRQDPAAYLRYRKSLELGMQGLFGLTQRGSKESEGARAQYENDMRQRLAPKPELADLMIPKYAPLCKRITPGPGYLEALTESHVTVVTDTISHIDADSIVTIDGVRRPVDTIICATGFETHPGQGFPIYGRDGLNLRDKYRRRPETYLGLCTDGFPNFFQSLGPNTWQGSGSLLIMIEYVNLYLAKVLQRFVHDDIRTVEPRRKHVQNFTNFCEKYFRSTVYTDDCVCWYKTPPSGNATTKEREGAKITALWPGSHLHAIHVMNNVRWEDFEIESCDDDDFGWFGNGRTAMELDVENRVNPDRTYYLNGARFVHEPKDW